MSVMKSFSLEGKNALITGGNGGIGFAIARAYSEAGARVAFVCSRESSLEQGLKNYKEAGIDVKGYICDITDEARVSELVASVERDLGCIDILVNNAGVIKRTPTHEMSVEDFRRVIDVDLTAQFIVTKAVITGMMARRSGKIINIGSIMSEVGREGVAAYNAAKGGLKIFTRSLASEYAGYGINVNAIGPGFTETDMTIPLRTALADGSKHPFSAYVEKRTPAGRWGTTTDMEGPALFLASSASDYVNGHMLYVDGGLVSSIGKM